MCELANITISHSNFINNKALNWGVIVALENVFYANVTVTHSQFFNNSASQGAMSVYVIKESKIQINISRSEVINNFAGDSGGVVSIENFIQLYTSPVDPRLKECMSTLYIIHCRFMNNTAKYGGVIYACVCPTYIIVATSQFIENSCRYRGGAMAIFENKRLTIIYIVSL